MITTTKATIKELHNENTQSILKQGLQTVHDILLFLTSKQTNHPYFPKSKEGRYGLVLTFTKCRSFARTKEQRHVGIDIGKLKNFLLLPFLVLLFFFFLPRSSFLFLLLSRFLSHSCSFESSRVENRQGNVSYIPKN